MKKYVNAHLTRVSIYATPLPVIVLNFMVDAKIIIIDHNKNQSKILIIILFFSGATIKENAVWK
jgi:hypothetical protein